MRVFTDLDELASAVGTHLGFGEWHDVTQERIDLFAEATGDRQWIHVDPGRAAKGPFGTTVAHGFLTLAMIPQLTDGILRVDGLNMSVNYGINKVRFPAHVPVGSHVRAGVELVSVDPASAGSMAIMRVTVEREDFDKPVCVAELAALMIP